MPRFYHSNDPALSDLNRAKKSVNRDYAKQYQSQDGDHDNLGQTQDVDSIYGTLTTRLTSLHTALQDLFNILEVGTSGNPQVFSPTLVANFQQFASRVLTEVKAVQLIMGRIKGFNIFTPPQAEELSSIVAEISALQDFTNGALNIAGDYQRGEYLINSVQSYEPALKLLLQFLTGASSNYHSVEANPKTVETKTGGALVPSYNGEGHFGSDGYRIGDFYTYTDPRRFY